MSKHLVSPRYPCTCKGCTRESGHASLSRSLSALEEEKRNLVASQSFNEGMQTNALAVVLNLPGSTHQNPPCVPRWYVPNRDLENARAVFRNLGASLPAPTPSPSSPCPFSLFSDSDAGSMSTSPSGSGSELISPAASRTLSDEVRSYRGTSLMRKRTPLGPYRTPMPRVLGSS